MEMQSEADRFQKVIALRESKDEAKEILRNEDKYAYVVEVVKRLVHFGNRKELWDLRIEQIGDFYELKLKGSMIGKINLRIYFAFNPKAKEVVILKAYKKEEDAQLSKYIYLCLEHRYAAYLSGRNLIGASAYSIDEKSAENAG